MGAAVVVEPGLGRLARVAAIAAISHQQHAEPALQVGQHPLVPVAQGAGIAVEIDDGALPGLRRRIPRQQRQPVAGADGLFAHVGGDGRIDQVERPDPGAEHVAALGGPQVAEGRHIDRRHGDQNPQHRSHDHLPHQSIIRGRPALTGRSAFMLARTKPVSQAPCIWPGFEPIHRAVVPLLANKADEERRVNSDLAFQFPFFPQSGLLFVADRPHANHGVAAKGPIACRWAGVLERSRGVFD